MKGCTVELVVIIPCSKHIMGTNSSLWSFCTEFAYSPCAYQGSLCVLINIRLTTLVSKLSLRSNVCFFRKKKEKNCQTQKQQILNISSTYPLNISFLFSSSEEQFTHEFMLTLGSWNAEGN